MINRFKQVNLKISLRIGKNIMFNKAAPAGKVKINDKGLIAGNEVIWLGEVVRNNVNAILELSTE